MMMKLEDLKVLQNYALRLADSCAVPSKLMSQLVSISKKRYNDELGGNRLTEVVLVVKGDKKSQYVEPDYSAGGAFKLCNKTAKKGGGAKFNALQHVGGTMVSLETPLTRDHYIEGNEDDFKSKIVSKSSLNEILCMKVFEKAGKSLAVPPPLADTRVGQASPSQNRRPMMQIGDELALEDGSIDDVAPPIAVPAAKANSPKKKLRRREPAGHGAVVGSAGPPVA